MTYVRAPLDGFDAFMFVYEHMYYALSERMIYEVEFLDL